MDSAIPISAINDFLYCPRSLYLHSIYSSFETSVFHDTPQINGAVTHEGIEKGRYSTSKHILQGLPVYSSRLGIKGKIDLYDRKKKYLVERKYRVKKVYKGFRYQLYAQMYCLKEIGLPVKRLFLQSLCDNKHYEVPLPAKVERKEFETVIEKMKSFGPLSVQQHSCNHCRNNIYGLLNW
jgi:CRISPR-associated protein Cas4